ncbi:hypothetical protein BDZ85DRAFT_251376 [Elsinoe ampelina]|uniref:Uncharacterized protein n=1 Tax=Elsinoe ampelina TaxID=302913 RepID=A0A6A6G7K0_9PEZI|nr:hypothetical protein BDZ85DRAFT_251376 [Elsinoe ampelina]
MGPQVERASDAHFEDRIGLIKTQPDFESMMILTEGEVVLDLKVPLHVISLMRRVAEMPIFLLDTKAGVIYWHEGVAPIGEQSLREQVTCDYPEVTSKLEADWRDNALAWAVPDSFEVLKDLIRNLDSFPTGSREVNDRWPANDTA